MFLPLRRILAATAVAASLAGCTAENPATADRAGGRGGRGRGNGGGAPVPVVTARAVSTSVPVTLPAVGTAEPISSVQVRAQVTGQLSGVHFSEGQTVQKGELLFTIDPRPFEVALQQAQALLARDTAQAKNADAQTQRFEDLFKRGLIPRDQYETQRASAASLQATLDADRAAVENAKLNLQYTKITAPITGRTGALNAHAGDLIRANDTAPLLVINQLSPIYVTFSVPGRYLGEIRRYQQLKPLQVQARLSGNSTATDPNAPPGAAATTGGEGRSDDSPPPELGTVTFIDNGVDATTGTIKLKGTFANSHNLLWPGQFVQVTMVLTTKPNAIVVPAQAVQDSQDGQFVYVVSADRTASVRRVQVERQHNDQVVIAQGLSAGEEVVTDGQLRLTPGAHVTTGGARGAAGRSGRSGSDAASETDPQPAGRGKGSSQ